MKIEHVKVSLKELKENIVNPRIITKEQFAKLVVSLKKEPWMLDLREIIVDEDNVILCGNMRWKALQEIGVYSTKVKRISGLTTRQKKALVIKDNNEYGDWNYDMLANDFEEDDLLEWGFEMGDIGCKAYQVRVRCPKCGEVFEK